MNLPGYDAWKLATPPEYECDGPEFPCPHCHGRGQVWTDPCYETCRECKGTGEDRDEGWQEVEMYFDDEGCEL
jgi:RecJ-like exonuclease